MFDLILRGGTAVTPQEAGLYDIAINGEQVAAVTAPNVIRDDPAAVMP